MTEEEKIAKLAATRKRNKEKKQAEKKKEFTKKSKDNSSRFKKKKKTPEVDLTLFPELAPPTGGTTSDNGDFIEGLFDSLEEPEPEPVVVVAPVVEPEPVVEPVVVTEPVVEPTPEDLGVDEEPFRPVGFWGMVKEGYQEMRVRGFWNDVYEGATIAGGLVSDAMREVTGKVSGNPHVGRFGNSIKNATAPARDSIKNTRDSIKNAGASIKKAFTPSTPEEKADKKLKRHQKRILNNESRLLELSEMYLKSGDAPEADISFAQKTMRERATAQKEKVRKEALATAEGHKKEKEAHEARKKANGKATSPTDGIPNRNKNKQARGLPAHKRVIEKDSAGGILNSLLGTPLRKAMDNSGDGITISNVEQNTDEWMEQRQGLIGASAIGALLGHSKYKSATDALKAIDPKHAEANKDKKDNQSSYADLESADIARGNRLEDPIREAYAAKYGNTQDGEIYEAGIITNKAWEGFGISPDALIGDKGMLEIKAPRPGNPMSGHPSEEYYDQMQLQMHVAGRDWVDFIQGQENKDGSIDLSQRKRIEKSDKWASENKERLDMLKEGIKDGFVAAHYEILSKGDTPAVGKPASTFQAGTVASRWSSSTGNHNMLRSALASDEMNDGAIFKKKNLGKGVNMASAVVGLAVDTVAAGYNYAKDINGRNLDEAAEAGGIGFSQSQLRAMKKATTEQTFISDRAASSAATKMSSARAGLSLGFTDSAVRMVEGSRGVITLGDVRNMDFKDKDGKFDASAVADFKKDFEEKAKTRGYGKAKTAELWRQSGMEEMVTSGAETNAGHKMNAEITSIEATLRTLESTTITDAVSPVVSKLDDILNEIVDQNRTFLEKVSDPENNPLAPTGAQIGDWLFGVNPDLGGPTGTIEKTKEAATTVLTDPGRALSEYPLHLIDKLETYIGKKYTEVKANTVSNLNPEKEVKPKEVEITLKLDGVEVVEKGKDSVRTQKHDYNRT